MIQFLYKYGRKIINDKISKKIIKKYIQNQKEV